MVGITGDIGGAGTGVEWVCEAKGRRLKSRRKVADVAAKSPMGELRDSELGSGGRLCTVVCSTGGAKATVATWAILRRLPEGQHCM